MGKRAAREIDRALRGSAQDADGQGDGPAPSPTPIRRQLAAINTFYHPQAGAGARAAAPCRRAARGATPRSRSASISSKRSPRPSAASPAAPASQCDNCVHYCPDLAVKREADGYVVLTDYCKGCGLCVKECPTGSMKMVEEVAMNARDRTHCARAADAADRQPRGRLGGASGATQGGPALSDHAANADTREDHRIPGRGRVRCRGHHARVRALGDGRLHPGFAGGRSRVHRDGVAGPAADARSCSITRAARGRRS